MSDEPRVRYRLLSDMRDFNELVQLELDIWQLPPVDAAPSALMVAFHHNGGLVIGGYWDERMVALALAFVARRGDEYQLWSHMAGVHADFQGRGLGRGIKFAQRRFALERGYTRIGWTHDPLLRGNANFNLRLLGAAANTYHINHYGEMQDAINAGLPSDRLEVHWDLQDERVAALARGEAAPLAAENPPFLLEKDDAGAPLANPTALAPRPAHCRVEIPRSVDAMRREYPERALAWRLALRDALGAAFDDGYTARDFEHRGERCWYLLARD